MKPDGVFMSQKKSAPCRFAFVGVFVLGLLGLLWTGRYYLRKETHADRTDRRQRIAAEMRSAEKLME